MLKNNRGFSLIELLIVMAIFVIVIAVTGDAFNAVLKHVSIQSKTAESNIEGVLGLEMMRKDIASAGFGLPWSFQSTPAGYSEASTGIAKDYNDAPAVPRAIFGGNNLGSTVISGSDYLVIRATNIGSGQAAQRWTYMNYTSMVKPTSPLKPVTWPKDNLQTGNKVIVVKVGLTNTFSKELVVDAANKFFTTYDATSGLPAAFEPTDPKINHYIYGVDDANDLHMPFNRADYYARIPASSELPKRCAPNTGVLYKAMVRQSNGTLNEMPLLDCVADMQVVYTLDTTSNGTVTDTDTISALTAEQIREQLKAVKVYFLTHEGGKDSHYSYPNTSIAVGPAGSGRSGGFNLTTITDYKNYRWKVYFMTVKPLNLNIATQ